MIDLVIFDCDGVLVDSEVISAQVLIAQLAALGVTIATDQVREQFLGRSFPSVAKTIRETFELDLPADFEQTYRAILLDRFSRELRPTPGLVLMLERLTLPKCVATSSSPPRAAHSLKITDLARFFGPNVFTATQVKNGKPAPDIFLFAAAQMGVDPTRCLVIEDSQPGVTAAQAAGAHVLAYRGGQHLVGSGFDFGLSVTTFDTWADLDDLLDKL
jgi:HAD superfamily hydrolase (TIGR01509 family)